jgi:hypothetical protein
VYAALIATAALGWHLISWWLGHMTRLRVLVEPTRLLMGEGPGENLTVSARNLSAHPIQAIAASYEIIGPPVRPINVVPTPHPSQSIPGIIPARSMGLRWIPKEDAEELGLVGVPIRAYVQTADREKPFYSKPVTIEQDAWDAVPAQGPLPYRVGPG